MVVVVVGCGLSSDYRTTPVNIVQLCTGLGCGNSEESDLFQLKKLRGLHLYTMLGVTV